MGNAPRARALATELQAARKDSGMSQKSLGEALGWSEAKVSRIENANTGVQETDVASLLAVLRVQGDDRQRLLTMTREIDNPAWWEVGRELPQQLRGVIDAEQHAVQLTDVALNRIPGLLQTRAYTRAILDAARLPTNRIDELTSIRQTRQDVLSTSDPLHMDTFIDEAVFLRPIGDAKVMAEQLRHILNVSEQDNVNVRVIPLASGAHVGLDGTFILFRFVKARPQAYVEARSAGVFLDSPEDVAPFLETVDSLQEDATHPNESREIIRSYMSQYEGET